MQLGFKRPPKSLVLPQRDFGQLQRDLGQLQRDLGHLQRNLGHLQRFPGVPQRHLGQLLELNQQVAARIVNGDPVTAPGLPLSLEKRVALVTEDCIRPQ